MVIALLSAQRPNYLIAKESNTSVWKNLPESGINICLNFFEIPVALLAGSRYSVFEMDFNCYGTTIADNEISK